MSDIAEPRVRERARAAAATLRALFAVWSPFLLRVLGVLVLGVAATEMLLRSGPVIERLPVPSIGAGSEILDFKVEYLERYLRRHGSIDCLFIGPSTVNRAVDPNLVSASFEAVSGHPLRCFNLGVEGLRLSVALRLIPGLVEHYRPRLLVLSEFRSGRGRFGKLIDANPWLGQMSGEPSLNGWLIQHVRLVRHFLRLRIWLLQPALDRRLSGRLSELESTGFMPKVAVPAAQDDASGRRELTRTLANLRRMRPLPASLDALNALAAKPSMPPVMLVEMPIHPRLWAQELGGPNGYLATLDRVAATGLPLLRSSHLDLVPAQGWKDFRHLNDRGAALFSRWLGTALGEAVAQRRIPAPSVAEDDGS